MFDDTMALCGGEVDCHAGLVGAATMYREGAWTAAVQW